MHKLVPISLAIKYPILLFIEINWGEEKHHTPRIPPASVPHSQLLHLLLASVINLFLLRLLLLLLLPAKMSFCAWNVKKNLRPSRSSSQCRNLCGVCSDRLHQLKTWKDHVLEAINQPADKRHAKGEQLSDDSSSESERGGDSEMAIVWWFYTQRIDFGV